jgi:glutamate-ammonia-ligase adenylyltransferase
LIAGGRDPRLRVRATCDALRALTDTGRVTPQARDELIACYGELRRVEHRLQMIADEQTHKLPADPVKLEHAAIFLGAPDVPTFAAAFIEVLRTVTRHFDALFATAAPLGASGALIFTGTEDDPATLETLKGLGFTDPGMVSGVIRRWHHGRYPVMRSARARELLTALKPRLLQALAHAAQPDEAILNFDRFLSRLPAAIQLFALLRSNPDLLDLLSDILGTAPRLAEHLARQPRLVEAMLEHRAYAAEDLALAIADLDRQVRDADLQTGLEVLRRFKGELEFRIGVAWLKRECDVDVACRALSAVADTVLARVLDLAGADFARAHGRLAGAHMAVVALGKLGGREMAFGSDLDLIFVYDHPVEAEQSDGRSPLSPGLYFARLSQRCITALTSLSGEGRLYDVDMRLRPSGNAGPVAVSLERFAAYNLGEAWTWEHMALTRARPVAGPAVLQARIVDAATAALTAPHDAEKLRADVLDMHRRTMDVHGTDDPWNIKHARGGLMDCEFIAQYLILAGAQAEPGLLTGNTAQAFDRLDQPGLAALTRFLRTMQTTLRLCIDGAPDPARFPPGLQALLAAHGGVADLAALAEKLAGAQAQVRARFAELVGPAATR